MCTFFGEFKLIHYSQKTAFIHEYFWLRDHAIKEYFETHVQKVLGYEKNN